MSKLTRQDVVRLARLARLRLNDDEIDRFASELSAILEYVEQLNAVDVDSLEPTYQVTGLKNVTRDDVLDPKLTPAKELLKNVPGVEDSHIKVRRMIG